MVTLVPWLTLAALGISPPVSQPIGVSEPDQASRRASDARQLAEAIGQADFGAGIQGVRWGTLDKLSKLLTPDQLTQFKQKLL